LPRRAVTLAALVLAALANPLTAAQGVAETAGDRPNIIFIMADDLGYGDLGCFGQRTIQTPNLDAMARDGLRLTDFYAGTTVCRPSRLVLWTGQHTGHTAINSNAQYVLPQGAVTVAGLLHEAGYATGGVGKWALGDTQNSGHPNHQGFDFWFGYLNQSAAHNYYPEYLWRNRQQVPLAGNREGPEQYVSVQRTTYSHDVMTEEAFGFIRRSVQDAKPFLLHVHWTIPHANNQGGRATGDGMEVPDYGAHADKDWPATEKGFAAMITRLDGDVGRLVALLRELDIDQNTLVLFTSDNGPHNEGGHDHTFFDSNGPLRGFKRDLYEGGIRVPTIAWWPGTIQPGGVSAEPLAFYDFLSTACDIAGIQTPEHVDGVSFLPLLQGQTQASHEYLFWAYDDKRAVRAGRWKAVRPGKNAAWELYDLQQDLGEQTDLADQQPDVLQRLTGYADAAVPK
jgi:uncharacterized sulfatase